MAGGGAAQVRGVIDRGGRPSRPPPAEALNAPLFQSIIERMQDGGRWVVLDLGAVRPETVRVFTGVRCRLEIAELADSLDALNAEDDPVRLRERAEASLPPVWREPIDVVLCWDLLNYLTRPALAALMERVAARARRGTLAHALVVYSTPRMPVRPGCWVPLDEQRLANIASPASDRPAPRYTPEDLAHCMPRYTVERARLLRNGMQEFLFRL